MRNVKRVVSGLAIGLMLCQAVVFSQKPDRSTPPKPGPLPEFSIAPIRTFTLSNGLSVYFMEKREVPLVHMRLMIRAGSVDDGEDYGLANMTGAMLDEGAGPYDALQLADQIDFLGADISVATGYHSTTLSLHTPLSKLEKALPLLSLILLEPSFPEKELERLRKEQLTSFLQWRDEPRAISSYAFSRILYGEEHPYGHQIVGEASSVADLDRGDLVDFYETYYVPDNAALVVVGDISQEDLLPKLEDAFGSWASGDVPDRAKWETKPITQNTVYLIDKPGAAQSEIIIGRIGVDRQTEDYYDLLVMNTILGGSFASRLNQNLREEHGYTYGARSRFSFNNLPGPFQASSSVQTDVTDKALVEFMKELNGMREPVPDEELERAKSYVGLRYPENFQSVARIAGQLDDIFLHGLPGSFFDGYMGMVGNVSGSAVTRVARTYITPEAFAFVIVGDREKIENGVRELGLGEMKLLSIEDVLGPAPTIE